MYMFEKYLSACGTQLGHTELCQLPRGKLAEEPR